jgi:hypothetical protein
VMGLPATAPDELRKTSCGEWTRAGVPETAIICVVAALMGSSLFVMNVATGVYERAALGATTQTLFDVKGQSEIAYGTCTPIE